LHNQKRFVCMVIMEYMYEIMWYWFTTTFKNNSYTTTSEKKNLNL